MHRGGLSLVEALEVVLPPIVNEIKQHARGPARLLHVPAPGFGPFAQGPVALLARVADDCVFSVDALGLRPLWQIETGDAYCFCSEPGVVAVADTVPSPSRSRRARR